MPGGWPIHFVSDKENMQEDDSESSTVHPHPMHLLNTCVDGAAMIECSDCGEWFNTHCVSASPAALNNTDEPWYCTSCN